MKLQLTLNKKPLTADFRQEADHVTCTHADQSHTAQLFETAPGLYTVILADKVYQCALEKLPGGHTEVIVNGQRVPVTIQDPKRLRHGVGAEGQAGGRATLTSPMPGKVVRLLTTVGEEVAEGQGLVVVEAMKMQNEVQAPRAGKVTEIKVTEGQTVNAGEILAVVE